MSDFSTTHTSSSFYHLIQQTLVDEAKQELYSVTLMASNSPLLGGFLAQGRGQQVRSHTPSTLVVPSPTNKDTHSIVADLNAKVSPYKSSQRTVTRIFNQTQGQPEWLPLLRFDGFRGEEEAVEWKEYDRQNMTDEAKQLQDLLKQLPTMDGKPPASSDRVISSVEKLLRTALLKARRQQFHESQPLLQLTWYQPQLRPILPPDLDQLLHSIVIEHIPQRHSN